MRSRFAGTVLNALLAGQIAFGAAAIGALAMKERAAPRALPEIAASLAATTDVEAVVR